MNAEINNISWYNNQVSDVEGVVYNVTIKVQEVIKADWLRWITEVHVPEVLNTQCFVKATISRLTEIDDSEGPTFTIQYIAESKAQYNRYIELFANEMRQKSYDQWGNQFIAFRSVMHIIQVQ